MENWTMAAPYLGVVGLLLAFLIYAFIKRSDQGTTEMVEIACTIAKNKQLVSADDKVIITAGVPFGNAGSTNLLRIAKIISKENLT